MSGNRFYRLQDDRWQELAGPSSGNPIKDFAMDHNGRLWALNRPWRDDAWMIGQYDPGTASWAWSELEPAGDSLVREYHAIQVDARGRVWLAGTYQDVRLRARNFVTVFEPVPGAPARRIVEYDDDNSNYQGDISPGSLRLGPDGRIWTADDRLVWMDSTAPELPRPLPAWLASATSLRGRIFLTVGSVIILTPMMVFLIRQRRRQERAPVQ
jgi:hypothetical protein